MPEMAPVNEVEQDFLVRACKEPFLIDLAKTVIGAKHLESEKLTREGLERGVDATVLLNGGLIAGMSIVGERFARDEIFVPEVLVCARAMKAGMAVVKPILVETGVKRVGTAVMGTVKGDLHDIGKNIVGMMFEGAGLQVIELGVNVPAEKFMEAVVKHDAQILGMSALLTTTMLYMRTVIEAFDKAGLREKVRIMVGGAPLTQKFADSVGADGWAPNAASAVGKMRELMGIGGGMS